MDTLACKEISGGKIDKYVLEPDARIDLVNRVLPNTGWSPEGIRGLKTFTRGLVIDDLLRAKGNAGGERKTIAEEANRVLQTKITASLNDPIEQRYISYLRAAYSGYIQIALDNQIDTDKVKKVRKHLEDAERASLLVEDGTDRHGKREVLQLLVKDLTDKLDNIQ